MDAQGSCSPLRNNCVMRRVQGSQARLLLPSSNSYFIIAGVRAEALIFSLDNIVTDVLCSLVVARFLVTEASFA